MSKPILDDKRAADLLSRVGDDLTSLRHDVRTLLRHATKRTLPDVGRGLAESGRANLLYGRDYAADQFRRVGRSAREHPAGFSISGLLVLGAVAAGIYLLINSECCRRVEEEEELLEE